MSTNSTPSTTATLNPENPLLQPFSLKDQVVPFNLIQVAHYIPALEKAIEEAQAHIQKIKNQTVPTFENVILALEQASEKVDRISTIYFNLFSAEASDAHQALAQEISMKLSAFLSDISLDEKIFQQIKSVYEQRQNLNLTGEDLKLTEKIYKDFSRNGALLPHDKKEQLRQVDQELSHLSPLFSENVLKATNAFELWISEPADLDGLPEGVREAAALAAEQKGQKGKWLFTLHGPSLIAFLTYASNRSLREKIWKASASKAYHGTFDNSETIKKIVTLKAQRAHLLGFKDYAEYILEERMARSANNVFDFLAKLLGPAKKAAIQDLEDVKSFKKSLEGNDEIKPWDFAYYSEKLKEQKYAFNEEELRPYF